MHTIDTCSIEPVLRSLRFTFLTWNVLFVDIEDLDKAIRRESSVLKIEAEKLDSAVKKYFSSSSKRDVCLRDVKQLIDWWETY